MPITVTMIEEKEFKTKMRGYDPVEVDEFLDQICDEMVAMQEEITTLNQRLSQQQSGRVGIYAPAAVPAPAMASVPVPAPVAVQVQPAPIPQPVQQPNTAPAAEKREEASEAAQRMLAQAQKVYDQTIAEANSKAEDILSDASERAEREMEALQEDKQALEEEIKTLKAAARDYRERFLRLLDDQQHLLKTETALFGDEE